MRVPRESMMKKLHLNMSEGMRIPRELMMKKKFHLNMSEGMRVPRELMV